MLRFCSKANTTQVDPLNESSVSEGKSVKNVGEDIFLTVSAEDEKILGTESDSPRVTQDREHSDTLVNKSGNFPLSLEEPKLPSCGSSTKRASSSAVLISPKKKHASGSSKRKISTPNNQRTISDFFRK